MIQEWDQKPIVNWIGIKVFYESSSQEVFDRIAWCKENNIQFITRVLRGIVIDGNAFTEDEMKTTTSVIIGNVEFDLSTMKAKEIGTAFFFTNKDDVMRFKLVF